MNKLRKPESDFTQIPNGLLRDRNVSLKAKGVYCLLFSKPDDWIYIEEVLVRESTDGRDAFRSAITELARAGWLSKKQVMEKGAFGHTEIWLHAVAGKSVDGLSVDGKSDATKTDKTNTDEITPSVSPQPTKATKRGQLPLTSLAEIIGDAETIPDDWFNTVSSRYRWEPQFIDDQWQRFCNHHVGKGTKWRDWKRAWLNWCAGSKERTGSRTNGTGPDRGLAAALSASFHSRNGTAQPGSTVSGGQGADTTGADGGGTSGRLASGEIAF